MPNQQLIDYVKAQLKLGVMKPDLIKAVQAAGWNQTDMDAAFAVAEGRAPAAPAAPAVPAAPVASPQMPAQPQQPAPATIRPSGPAAVQPPSVIEAMQKPRPAASSHDPGPGMRFNTVRGPFTSKMLYVLVCLVIIGGAIVWLLPIIRPLIFGGLTPADTTSASQTITPDQTQQQTQPAPMPATASTSTPASTSPQFVVPAASVNSTGTASTTAH